VIRSLAPLLLLTACHSFRSLPEGEPATFETRVVEEEASEYRIQPGDGLSIKFAHHPLRNLELVVRPDGRISIPFAEETLVAGRTVAEADALLTEKVAKHLRDPELTIVVATIAKSQVFVGGEVSRPGAVPLVPGLTAFQALVAAGGVAPTGDETSVILVRAAGPGKRIVRRLSFADQGLVEHDVVLGPFDIVYVPRTFIADVGAFVNSHINAIVPRAVSFAGFYNLEDSPVP
jgi:protein involved in polysaccharide export with SLBB domain